MTPVPLSMYKVGPAVQIPLQEDDWGLNRARWWGLKFCWFPKRCFLTGAPLWGKRAYHGENWITGPGEPVVDHYWIEKDAFLLWQLKK